MSPEEKHKIADKIKGVIESHMKGAKKAAVFVAGMALAVTLEYFGVQSLDTASWENLGRGMPDWYKMSTIGLMGFTAAGGVGGLGVAVKEGVQALKERIKLWNFERKNKE